MSSILSYFVLFGIITIINGKPANQEDSYFVKNEYELQKILQTMANQGKYDIVLTHTEAGPKTRHEDKARISHYDEKPLKYFTRNEKSNSAGYASPEYENSPSLSSVQAFNQLFKKNTESLLKYNDNENDILQTLLGTDNNKVKKYKERAVQKTEYDNVDDILAYLGDLQKNLADDGNYASQLRCTGNKCSRNRNGDKRDYVKADDDKYDRDGLRCRGNRCTRDGDYRADDRYTYRDGLRCKGNNCARSRDGKANSYRDEKRDDSYDDNEGDLKHDSNIFSKKFKINDDLDAVVLGVSDADRLLSKFNVPKQQRSTNKLRSAKSIDNVNLENLLNSRGSNDKTSKVEAVVFDLTQVEDGEVIAKQIKRLLSENNELFEGDYAEYGNAIEEHINNGVVNFDKPAKLDRTPSKILAHNEDNNNVYVPQWLLNEVLSKTKLRDLSQSQLLKSMFPLTRQQKARMYKNGKPRKVYRRNFEQDVGVPFHLEVQGLGHVTP